MLTNKQFEEISKELYKGKALTAYQKEALELISESFEKFGGKELNQLAYVLATAYHEVGPALKPVREGFASTDKGAIDAVTRLFDRKIIKTNYAAPGTNGKSFYGRGYVQLTWEKNYKEMGKILNVDLFNNPDLALEAKIAADILAYGMIKGTFTGKKLSDYISKVKADYVGARRIINGTDKAQLISEHANKFLKALDNK
jgi:predicted chitinase